MSENKPKHEKKSQEAQALILENLPECAPEEKSEQHTELNELIEKYNESVHELIELHAEEMDDKAIEHFRQINHELRAELIHLEESRHKATEQAAENNTHFFNHHMEVIRHANDHWHEMKEHLEDLFEAFFEEECEELMELHHRIQHLLKEIEREEFESHKKSQHSEAPHPMPPHSHNGNDHDD